jgi:hypothetical protein
MVGLASRCPASSKRFGARSLVALAALAMASACMPAGGPPTAPSVPVAAAPEPLPLPPFLDTLKAAGVEADIPARGKFVLVNIPSYTLVAIEDGKPVLWSRVVVGNPGTPTPERLFSNMTGVKFNPDWTPTPSMIRNEAKEYVPPGANNPLGRIKLNLDNDEYIYLHDTNQKGYFERDVRALSHGCIRVQQIKALTAWAMGVDEAEVDRSIRTGRTFTTPLPEDVPVLIGYYTTFPTEFGSTESYADVYVNSDAEQRAYLERAQSRRRAADRPRAVTPTAAAGETPVVAGTPSAIDIVRPEVVAAPDDTGTAAGTGTAAESGSPAVSPQSDDPLAPQPGAPGEGALADTATPGEIPAGDRLPADMPGIADGDPPPLATETATAGSATPPAVVTQPARAAAPPAPAASPAPAAGIVPQTSPQVVAEERIPLRAAACGTPPGIDPANCAPP